MGAGTTLARIINVGIMLKIKTKKVIGNGFYARVKSLYQRRGISKWV